MISTRDLSRLPDVDRLRAVLQAMAVLDAILSPEWEYRYYSFDSRWAEGRQMGSMRNGSGDDFFALFNPAGCFLKGFAHEAEMAPDARRPKRVWPGVLDSVPEEFGDALAEPAFTVEDTTFCVWRRYADPAWQAGAIEFPPGPDPDGSEMLLSPLDGRPETYQAWAEDYYEQEVRLSAVRHVYDHRPLTDKIVTQVNPDISLEDVAADLEEIGYPSNPAP